VIEASTAQLAMAFSIKDGTAQKAAFGSAVLSTATQIALAAIITRLATLTPKSSPLFGATIAAVVFDFIVLIILAGIVIFTLVARSNTSRTLQLSLSATSFVLFITASILSIYVLGRTWVNPASAGNDDKPDDKPDDTYGPVLAGFVIWTINMVAQTTLHIFRSLRKREQAPPVQTESIVGRQASPRSIKRSLSIPLKSLSPSSSPFSRSTFEASSPTLPNHSSTSTHSSTIRHSIQQVIRPITSRTKLILAHGVTPRDSGSFAATRGTDSLEISCRGDGFENWDTSAVENGFANPLGSRPNTGRKRLEVIPGSRPVSPAKPLDGPFPDLDDSVTPDKLPLPDSPMQSPIVPAADTESIASLPVSPSLRRSSSIQEAHIHPLFRSHSPTPPPTPSADTVITASPFAGQVVHGDHAMAPRRMQSRNNSRPSSPHSFASPRTAAFPNSPRRPSNLSTRHPLELEPEDVPEMPKL
jgi:hypothetical protein